MNSSPLSQLSKRLFAWMMAQMSSDEATMGISNCSLGTNLGGLKRSLLGQLQGTVLEIGPGTGASFAYYPPGIAWIGIEPNPFMHDYLRATAKKYALASLELYEGTAEAIALPDESVDAAVSSHVLCSVGDQTQALREIRRVLKPGGQFIFLEHVAAAAGTWERTLQNGLTPLWQTLFDNCHPNRETWLAIEAAGFERTDWQNFRLVFPVVSPHIAGVVYKST